MSPASDLGTYAAIEIMKLKHILILQNKIDLIKEEQAREQHEQILKFIEGTVAEGALYPHLRAVEVQYRSCVCEYIIRRSPVPEGLETSPANQG